MAPTITHVPPMSEAAAMPQIDPAVIEAGKQQFLLCQACHGPDGQGLEMVGPPLAGSEWVLGPVENLIRIQLRGLQGPIKVKGKEYSFVAPMPAQPFQTDDQIAHVLTYVRNSWGNRGSQVEPAQVAALRNEVGMPPLTQADLIPPAPVETAAPPPATTTAAPGPAAPARAAAAARTETPAAPPPPAAPPLGLPVWAWLLILAWIAVCVWPVLRRNA
jgi:mono/diheme cytochrome c family protein